MKELAFIFFAVSLVYFYRGDYILTILFFLISCLEVKHELDHIRDEAEPAGPKAELPPAKEGQPESPDTPKQNLKSSATPSPAKAAAPNPAPKLSELKSKLKSHQVKHQL